MRRQEAVTVLIYATALTITDVIKKVSKGRQPFSPVT